MCKDPSPATGSSTRQKYNIFHISGLYFIGMKISEIRLPKFYVPNPTKQIFFSILAKNNNYLYFLGYPLFKTPTFHSKKKHFLRLLRACLELFLRNRVFK